MFKISLRQEKLFATIKTVCELVCNLLRTLTKSWRIQNLPRSPLSVIPPLTTTPKNMEFDLLEHRKVSQLIQIDPTAHK